MASVGLVAGLATLTIVIIALAGIWTASRRASAGLATGAGAGVTATGNARPPGAQPAAADLPDKLLAMGQVTFSVGLDASTAFSPDGSMLAFSSSRQGAFELFVKPFT